MKIILLDMGVGLRKQRDDIVASPRYPPGELNYPTQCSLTWGTPQKEQNIILCSLYIGPYIGDM